MVDFDAIPEELRGRDQWVCWVEEKRNGKTTKIPKQPDGSGANAKSNDMATWGPFEEAEATAEERQGWGIGFMFSEADPYTGIDIDGCIRLSDGQRRPELWLPKLKGFKDTFLEVSPSGHGLHAIAKDTDVPEWWKNQVVHEEKDPGKYAEFDVQNDHGEVEVAVYESGRFFTVTGNVLYGYETEEISPVEDLHEWLVAAWLAFNDDLPFDEEKAERQDPGTDINVYDVLSRSEYPPGERRAHPVHGSSTGSNFMVDEGGETWRCWSGAHQCTGDALHLIGMQEGLIDCGEWRSGEIASKTWADVFRAAEDRGLIERENNSTVYTAAPDGGASVSNSDTSTAGPSGPTGPTGPTAPGDGEDEDRTLATFKSACEHFNIEPSKVASYRGEGGQKFFRPLSTILVTGDKNDDIAAAVMSFNEGANELSGTQRQAVIGRVVAQDLDAHGEFFTVPRGMLYFFDDEELEIYRVDGDGNRTLNELFQAMVWEKYHLFSGRFSRNLGGDLLSYIRRTAPERDVYQFAHYNETAGEVYVSDMDTGYYAVTLDGIEWRPNGTDVFFLERGSGEPFEYIEDEDDRNELPGALPGELPHWRTMGEDDPIMRMFSNRVNFDENAALGPLQQRQQLYLHLHTLPFVDAIRSRPIMAWIGKKGSGKTTTSRAIGKFFKGPDFAESTMPAKKDDFVAKVTNQTLAFVDNYDDEEEWANDILAAIATGAGVDRRELYTTNDLYSEVPRCWLSITSRSPPFRRDDVADRTLVFRVERFDEPDEDGEGGFIGTGDFFEQVNKHRDTLWSYYLDNLRKVLIEWIDTDTAGMTTSHRMADWAIFARVVADALDIPNVDELLEMMETERATFALENEVWAAVIGDWIEEDPQSAAEPKKASELIDALQNVAEENSRSMAIGSAQGLGGKLSTYSDELRELYGMQIEESPNEPNKYWFDVGDDHQRVGLDRF